MVDYKTIIEKLNLQPLAVEGGYFDKIITLTDDSNNEIGSSIYFLVTPDSFSSLHKVLKDEIWYFLEGDPLVQIQLNENDEFVEYELGKVSEGKKAVSLVSKNVWQATKLKEGGSWALVATVVVPGFEETDFISYDHRILNKFKNICDIEKYIYK
jgi:predicted cupin superfamily sugar epimerase